MNTLLAIMRVGKKLVCNECFNTLSAKERKGRGARPWRWVPDDVPRAKCSKCGREGVHDEEMDH